MEDILSEHDILFLDIQMEGMDGQETAFAFRSQNRNAVLVFVTGVAVPTPEMFKVYPLSLSPETGAAFQRTGGYVRHFEKRRRNGRSMCTSRLFIREK